MPDEDRVDDANELESLWAQLARCDGEARADVLDPWWDAGGFVVMAVMLAVGLWRMREEEVARTGVITAVLYAALAPVFGYRVEWAGATMLVALGAALGLMFLVLHTGHGE